MPQALACRIQLPVVAICLLALIESQSKDSTPALPSRHQCTSIPRTLPEVIRRATTRQHLWITTLQTKIVVNSFFSPQKPKPAQKDVGYLAKKPIIFEFFYDVFWDQRRVCSLTRASCDHTGEMNW